MIFHGWNSLKSGRPAQSPTKVMFTKGSLIEVHTQVDLALALSLAFFSGVFVEKFARSPSFPSASGTPSFQALVSAETNPSRAGLVQHAGNAERTCLSPK